jgi:ABC-type sugar transport system ATPase subunit
VSGNEDLANICNRIIVFGHGRAYQELTGAAVSVEGVTAASHGADIATSLAGKT